MLLSPNNFSFYIFHLKHLPWDSAHHLYHFVWHSPYTLHLSLHVWLSISGLCVCFAAPAMENSGCRRCEMRIYWFVCLCTSVFICVFVVLSLWQRKRVALKVILKGVHFLPISVLVMWVYKQYKCEDDFIEQNMSVSMINCSFCLCNAVIFIGERHALDYHVLVIYFVFFLFFFVINIILIKLWLCGIIILFYWIMK